MHLELTAEEHALQARLRSYFQQLVTPALLDEVEGNEGGGPLYTQALRKLGADGWLGIGWPREVGGQGRPALEQFLFFDEAQRAGFPIPFLTLCTVGPTLMKYGTDEQKARLLPAMLRGELQFAIGYTEPEAGTDLAALRTRAVRDGDSYVVTGQKVFTSMVEHAGYIWLAVRTDTEAPKHQGLSILMVDPTLPGVSITPIDTLGGNRTSTTYYDQVRVPVSMRVGRENEGWKLITTQLNHERVVLLSPGAAAFFLEETLAWARETRTPSGRRVLDESWVQLQLARVHSLLSVLELMHWRHAWNIDHGVMDPAESSRIKVFGSEALIELYQCLLEVLGPAGCLQKGSPGALLRGRVERYYRATLVLTFGGGNNEVQRDLIATVGLGMPRPSR
ncbi:acyl-CoA dehydrogenase [Myxococcus stipitatus DSM 14675]|uniref:Acyl-CoA dehydrogenase n=1 Tax=Myxococcus stipitatus (strain DSM 14675 / JCM 12634 / Mx s8) TaxID=1278073 RepID=L7UB26_MYXSD|nr:acyl-CoA dehydrogenase family protein [Myxococcus stipitatus]AGC46111.1 acyl-CoA dehydrogenase [Myxococcus stipitatus DSM 14675]